MSKFRIVSESSDSISVMTESGWWNHANVLAEIDPFCHSNPARCMQWRGQLGRPHWTKYADNGGDQ